MKLLDRYIVFRFLGTFFFVISLILLIAIVFDVSEKVDNFVQHDIPLNDILFDYYMNFAFYYGNLFSALIIFVAVIIFTSRLAQNTEIVAILASGVSFNRLLRPYFIAATVLVLLSLYLNNFFIPRANETRLDFEWTYINEGRSNRYRNLHRKIGPDTYIYLESFNTAKKAGYHFSLEEFSGDSLRYKLLADFLRWDSTENIWRLENYYARRINGWEETLERGNRKDTVLAFLPEDLVTKLYTIETMTFPELNTFIEQEEFRGSENLVYYYVERHRRFSLPLATYVLTLIGVSIAYRKRRGGMGMNIALGFGAIFIYIFFMQVSTTFATNGNLPAGLAVWIPNITFGVVALFLYRRALE